MNYNQLYFFKTAALTMAVMTLVFFAGSDNDARTMATWGALVVILAVLNHSSPENNVEDEDDDDNN